VPVSIQRHRSAEPSLRIVCPNGHLGFAPIKPGSFAIGCAGSCIVPRADAVQKVLVIEEQTFVTFIEQRAHGCHGQMSFASSGFSD